MMSGMYSTTSFGASGGAIAAAVGPRDATAVAIVVGVAGARTDGWLDRSTDGQVEAGVRGGRAASCTRGLTRCSTELDGWKWLSSRGTSRSNGHISACNHTHHTQHTTQISSLLPTTQKTKPPNCFSSVPRHGDRDPRASSTNNPP
jgi:hypothetical protein